MLSSMLATRCVFTCIPFSAYSSSMYVQSDVSPVLIMKRVRDASGAKYSVHNESARRAEPIAPVGTNYTPVGKVDIGALRKGAPKDVISSKVVSVSDGEVGYLSNLSYRELHTHLQGRSYLLYGRCPHLHRQPSPLKQQLHHGMMMFQLLECLLQQRPHAPFLLCGLLFVSKWSICSIFLTSLFRLSSPHPRSLLDLRQYQPNLSRKIVSGLS